MSSFDEADKRAKYAVIPKSTNQGRIVKLEPKVLKTQKETRTVLPEEQYLERLEKIICRDYFPELPKLKAQKEYMDAVSRNDVAKMRELQLRYATNRRTDRRTSPAQLRPNTELGERPTSPRFFDPDTPGPSRRHADEPTPDNYANREGDNEAELPKKKKKKSDIEGLSIDGYLNKFTSEDNASFEELTALVDHREKVRNAWMYDAETRHNNELVTQGKMLKAADEQLAIREDPEAKKERPGALDNWTYKARSTVLFHPEDAVLTPAEKAEQLKRNQRTINKNGTRFPEDLKNKPSQTSMARAAFNQAANQAGRIDITGEEMGVKSSTLGLVATPSVVPGIDDSPLMTWGEIEGTPFRLDGADIAASTDNAPAFKIPDVPLRDQIAHGISDTIAKRYRDKRKTAIEQAEKAHRTPRFGSSRSTDRLQLLSPAARRLASNQLGIRLGSDKSIRHGLTPSPITAARSSTPSSFGGRFGASPNIAASIRRAPSQHTTVSPASAAPSGHSPSLTDGLLQLNIPQARARKEGEASSYPSSSRPKASDFF